MRWLDERQHQQMPVASQRTIPGENEASFMWSNEWDQKLIRRQ